MEMDFSCVFAIGCFMFLKILMIVNTLPWIDAVALV